MNISIGPAATLLRGGRLTIFLALSEEEFDVLLTLFARARPAALVSPAVQSLNRKIALIASHRQDRHGPPRLPAA